MPTGMLTRKIQRHDASTSSPPIGGPSAAATPPTIDQTAIADARRAGGKAASSSASDVAVIIEPPTACTTRKAIRLPTPQANAQPSDPTRKVASPARKTRRRPMRSAIRPAGASSAAKTIV